MTKTGEQTKEAAVFIFNVTEHLHIHPGLLHLYFKHWFIIDIINCVLELLAESLGKQTVN